MGGKNNIKKGKLYFQREEGFFLMRTVQNMRASRKDSVCRVSTCLERKTLWLTIRSIFIAIILPTCFIETTFLKTRDWFTVQMASDNIQAPLSTCSFHLDLCSGLQWKKKWKQWFNFLPILLRWSKLSDLWVNPPPHSKNLSCPLLTMNSFNWKKWNMQNITNLSTPLSWQNVIGLV